MTTTGANLRGPRSRCRRALLVAVVLALLAAACSDDGDTAADDQPSTTLPSAQTMLRVGLEQWPECLNPITCDSPVLRDQILQHVLPVAFEIDAAGEYQPSPLLSVPPEIDVRGDGMTITYRIALEAHWDDGQPITSSDVRATWQAIMRTEGADTTGYELITGIDDADPQVAVVELSEPYGDWRTLFGGGEGWILKADAFGADTDLAGQFLDELPFSAAPYRLAAWDDDTAVLAGSDQYWDPTRVPEVDQVRLTLVEVAELAQPGAFDLLVPDGASTGPDGFATRRLPGTEVLGVWFDQRNPLLASLAHRQALTAMIDRELLIEEVSGRDAAPIDCLGWVPDVGPWCEAAEADLAETDADLASYVLAVEGWAPDGAGDLVRDGEPFAVPVRYDPDLPGAEAVAEELVEVFEAAGITPALQTTSTATWMEDRAAGRDTGVGVFAMDLGVSPQVTELYACPGGPPSSVLAWCPAAVVEPTATLASAAEPDEQLELVEEIGAVAAEASAWIPLFRLSSTYHVQPDRVQVPDARPAIGGPLARLDAFSVGG